MKICPKCGRQFERLLALSRVDNETMICDECGTMEALDDLPHRILTPQEVRRTAGADDVSEKRRLTLATPTGEIWLLDRDGTPVTLVVQDDDWYDQFKKLAEYEDLEEQGKLLKLPCKVGDTVYVIEADVENFDRFRCKAKLTETKMDYWMIPLIGKCVFLTHKEAEVTLSGMEGKDETD